LPHEYLEHSAKLPPLVQQHCDPDVALSIMAYAHVVSRIKGTREVASGAKGRGAGGSVMAYHVEPITRSLMAEEVPWGGQRTHARGGSGAPPRHVAL